MEIAKDPSPLDLLLPQEPQEQRHMQNWWLLIEKFPLDDEVMK